MSSPKLGYRYKEGGHREGRERWAMNQLSDNRGSAQPLCPVQQGYAWENGFPKRSVVENITGSNEPTGVGR
jgi:hypothetical protein